MVFKLNVSMKRSPLNYIYEELYNYQKKRKEAVMLTVPLAIVSFEKERSNGVNVTWTPKNVPLLRKTSFTVEFIVTISVLTPDPSDPALIMKLSNNILCNIQIKHLIKLK